MNVSEGPSRFRVYHATRLQELRVAAGLSQPQLAALVGRHRTWVSKAESGLTNLSIDTVALIRTALVPGEGEKLPLRSRVGAKVAAIRNAQTPRMSQETLSMMAGCNLKYVAQLEQIRVGTSLDQLGKVVDFLGIDYDEIFE
jgi:transcriptional regulator with XRE-family HTH domain